jgi:hypothetical protein
MRTFLLAGWLEQYSLRGNLITVSLMRTEHFGSRNPVYCTSETFLSQYVESKAQYVGEWECLHVCTSAGTLYPLQVGTVLPKALQL